jgi:hypothetical protein
MNAEDFTTALVTNGQAWMVLSLAAVLPILWAWTLIMHFGRPYASAGTCGGSPTCSSVTA